MGRRRLVAAGLLTGALVGFAAAFLRPRAPWEDPAVATGTTPPRPRRRADVGGLAVVDLRAAEGEPSVVGLGSAEGPVVAAAAPRA